MGFDYAEAKTRPMIVKVKPFFRSRCGDLRRNAVWGLVCRNFIGWRTVYQIWRNATFENANSKCRSCFIYMLWFSIRSFTNILVPIPAKGRTVSGRVKCRRSVRSLTHISRSSPRPVKVLGRPERSPPADSGLVPIGERCGRTNDGWPLHPTCGY